MQDFQNPETGRTVIGPMKILGLGDRTLNGGTNEVLCFLVALPAGTSNTFAGLSSTATFFFKSEQTSNN